MDAQTLKQQLDTASAALRSGELEHAETLFRHLILEAPPLGRGLALEGLGRALALQGQPEQGLTAMQDALSVLRDVAGKTHPATLGVLQNTARLCLLNGQIQESVGLGQEALASLIERDGENGIEVVGARIRLSSALYALRDFDSAEDHIRQALIILENTKTNNLDMATCFNNLGRIYEERGNLDEAILYHKKSVELRQALLGDHSETAFALSNLGIAFASAGRWAEAAETLRDALESYITLGLEASPDAQTCRANLALCEEAIL